jgi:atypical dual specificity phosphatase
MSPPHRFDWIEKPFLAAMARPGGADELMWLRAKGIEIIITLTESPLPRHWVNDAGLMAVHVPVEDLAAPSREQLELCIETIRRAKDRQFGAAVHCAAGIGRTGTVLAAWFVSEGLTAADAIDRVRIVRPGSVETPEQTRAVIEFAESLRGQ